MKNYLRKLKRNEIEVLLTLGSLRKQSTGQFFSEFIGG